MREVLSFLEALVLVLALSVDTFVASFAYGANRIRIPFRSVAVINLICTLMLALSLLAGSLIRPYIPQEITRVVCFSILLILGVVKLCDSTLKAYIRKNRHLRKKVSFSLLHLNFILQIYADPEQADKDASQELSVGEAVSLAVALSLDGLAVGFGAALTSINVWLAVGISLIGGALLMKLGCFIGRKAAEKLSLDLSWLSGVLLMVLAFLKL